jgi:hypothetical protein
MHHQGTTVPWSVALHLLPSEGGDAVNSDMTKRNHKGLPLCEKVKVLYLARKGETTQAEVVQGTYCKNKYLVYKLNFVICVYV